MHSLALAVLCIVYDNTRTHEIKHTHIISPTHSITQNCNGTVSIRTNIHKYIYYCTDIIA